MVKHRLDRLRKQVAPNAPGPPGEIVEVHLPYNGRGDKLPGVYDLAPGRSRLVIYETDPNEGMPEGAP